MSVTPQLEKNVSPDQVLVPLGNQSSAFIAIPSHLTRLAQLIDGLVVN